MFELHPTLIKDTVEITRLTICRVLLIRDETYPWIVLVPEREGLRDLDDLSATDRTIVMAEIDQVSKALKSLVKPYKINVAALGNMVEQLHIHVIARFQDDAAWPAPVWGVVPGVDYSEAKRTNMVKRLRKIL
ncbi:MAG: HIT domain-containing protein [Magnetovibrio sp.]|nr:HIT domain-containing protein [Magnetovibrio sp.]